MFRPDPTRRARAQALDAADPLARWRDEFVIPDPGVDLPRRQLARPDTEAHASRLAPGDDDEWAGDLIRVVGARLARPAARGRRRARPADRRRPGEVVVHDSTTVNIYQLVHVALGLRPDRRGDRASHDATTSRPTATSSTASPRLRGARSVTASTTSTTSPSSCARWSTTAPPRWSTSPPRRRGPTRRRRARGVGPVARRRRARARPRRGRRASSPSAAPTSSSTAARARRPSSFVSRGRCSRRSSSRSGAGSPSATSSRWARASIRARTSAAC